MHISLGGLFNICENGGGGGSMHPLKHYGGSIGLLDIYVGLKVMLIPCDGASPSRRSIRVYNHILANFTVYSTDNHYMKK